MSEYTRTAALLLVLERTQPDSEITRLTRQYLDALEKEMPFAHIRGCTLPDGHVGFCETEEPDEYDGLKDNDEGGRA